MLWKKALRWLSRLSRDYARFSVLSFFLAGKIQEAHFGHKNLTIFFLPLASSIYVVVNIPVMLLLIECHLIKPLLYFRAGKVDKK